MSLPKNLREVRTPLPSPKPLAFRNVNPVNGRVVGFGIFPIGGNGEVFFDLGRGERLVHDGIQVFRLDQEAILPVVGFIPPPFHSHRPQGFRIEIKSAFARLDGQP